MMTLKQARLKAGLSEAAAAAAMHINPVTLKNWEKGRNTPQPRMYIRIQKAYGLTKQEVRCMCSKEGTE